MPVTLQKWGHSVGVRLPKPMLEQIGLSEGAQVDVLVEGDHLVIRRARRKTGLRHSNLVLRSVERSSDGTRRLCAGAR